MGDHVTVTSQMYKNDKLEDKDFQVSVNSFNDKLFSHQIKPKQPLIIAYSE